MTNTWIDVTKELAGLSHGMTLPL